MNSFRAFKFQHHRGTTGEGRRCRRCGISTLQHLGVCVCAKCRKNLRSATADPCMTFFNC
eukprot:4830518-Prymnesium_polylepis.2